MRTPEMTPTKFGPAVLKVVWNHSTSATVDGRYLHWDKLRRYPLPKSFSGVTHQDWWGAIKLVRQGFLHPIPLIDSQGKPFLWGNPDPIPEYLHDFDTAISKLSLNEESGMDRDTRDQYIMSSLTEEAITSSQLEGASTTREVAKEMLRTQRAPRDVNERMILNNYRVMEAVRLMRELPLTPERVFNIHRIVTEGTMDDPNAVGRFRRAEESVRIEDRDGEVIHRPPPAETLEERMLLMCDFANEKGGGGFVHPVVRAIILHFWLAYDHPFVDGNGRCARALFYWSMLNSRYELAEFISISNIVRKAPVQYGRAFLYTETDGNDLTYFILYHLEVLRKAIDTLNEYLLRRQKELAETELRLREQVELNMRQVALIDHGLRHRGTLYTVAGHQKSHGIVYETARTDLRRLVKLGYLRERKRSRTYIYELTEAFLKKSKS